MSDISDIGESFGQAAGAAAASRLFRADGKIGDMLAIALQIATASSPPEGTSAYTEALESCVQVQGELIDIYRNELKAKDELLDAKQDVIAALFAEAAEESRDRMESLRAGIDLLRQLGIHFREIADTARNIQTALRDNDPRDAAEPAIGALQAIIDAGNLLADSIAEGGCTSIIDQLTDQSEPAEPAEPAENEDDAIGATEGEETT